MANGSEDWEDEGITTANLWPIPLRKLNTALLQRMNEDEFRRLRRAVQDRALSHFRSKAFAKELGRKLKKRRNPFRIELPKQLLTGRFKSSIILDALLPGRKEMWTPVHKRKRTVEISLSGLSFIDHPRETMNLLQDMARAECSTLFATVNFPDTTVLDIGPYVVWGLMRQDMVPFMSGGRISEQAKSVIETVGLRTFMQMGRFSVPADTAEISPFSLRQRRQHGTSQADNLALSVTTKEKVSDDFVETVEGWLAAMKPPNELTPDSKSWLFGMLGEVLDNAERHSQMAGDGDWAIAGFMVKRSVSGTDGRSQSCFVCHAAIVSVGQSIAQSIQSTVDEELRADLNGYCSKHQSRGMSNEALANVYALQDGISRIPQDSMESKGGVGMMDVVEFTNSLGLDGVAELPPQITIISGQTCVMFKPPYSCFRRDPDDTRKRLQWFNTSNSIDSPPDPTHIFDLPQRFPGTVIALRFSLPAEEAADDMEASKNATN